MPALGGTSCLAADGDRLKTKVEYGGIHDDLLRADLELQAVFGAQPRAEEEDSDVADEEEEIDGIRSRVDRRPAIAKLDDQKTQIVDQEEAECRPYEAVMGIEHQIPGGCGDADEAESGDDFERLRDPSGWPTSLPSGDDDLPVG